MPEAEFNILNKVHSYIQINTIASNKSTILDKSVETF